ncbi:hypothetical protein RAS12_30225 (plasmid) [Achromobacter seleniivolatilans]|uniref:Uncharacterized protein n=1 Tax=Achromobacter seleniivolatilans TaxID=3047478 RepID=A0ABY9MA63_9BURK|nr:hypothetical protein [Achromobacter sp. R39]WMD23911.1 hypothetical protein RAS12_30225 [Achromobacter sp. R39]
MGIHTIPDDAGTGPGRRVSSVARLRELPAVFSLSELCRLHEMPVEVAKVWVKRMARSGLIQFVGPRAAMYFNLLRFPNSPQDNLLEAVGRVYPDAVVLGAHVLHAYGWVTQIPQIVDVAVTPRRSMMAINGVHLCPRPRSWYREQQDAGAILRYGESPFALDSLTPMAALQDLRAHGTGDMWIPDPDDLYIPENVEEGVIRHEPAGQVGGLDQEAFDRSGSPPDGTPPQDNGFFTDDDSA